nr:Chain P, PROTEIN (INTERNALIZATION SIGNAL FROM EGFR)1I31_P Chain P, EPIDERMAL GROWTH FACTOR RECEPTOR [synthetic construct]
FYRALM